MWALTGLFFEFILSITKLYTISITGVFLSIFGHFRIIFSNLFGLPGFDSANRRESWVGMHHPLPGSTGTGVLLGPRDTMSVDAHPRSLKIGFESWCWIERDVRKKKEERRKKPRNKPLCRARKSNPQTHEIVAQEPSVLSTRPQRHALQAISTWSCCVQQ